MVRRSPRATLFAYKPLLRNVPAELRQSLGLGHAPDAWDTLAKTLSGAFPEDLLIEAGLLLFVVKDERGRPVCFVERALSPEA